MLGDVISASPVTNGSFVKIEFGGESGNVFTDEKVWLPPDAEVVQPAGSPGVDTESKVSLNATAFGASKSSCANALGV